MLRLSRLGAPLALAVMLSASASVAAHAAPVYDNLASSTDGTDPVYGNDPLAQSFSAGTGGMLNTVQLLLTSASNTNPNGALLVSLLADNAGAPGATIATLGSIINGAVPLNGLAILDVKPTASTVLSYGKTYWLAIAEQAANGIAWALTNDVSGRGVAGQSSSDRSLGVTPVASGGAFQMRIDVPEPASLAILAVGLLGAVRRRRA